MRSCWMLGFEGSMISLLGNFSPLSFLRALLIANITSVEDQGCSCFRLSISERKVFFSPHARHEDMQYWVHENLLSSSILTEGYVPPLNRYFCSPFFAGGTASRIVGASSHKLTIYLNGYNQLVWFRVRNIGREWMGMAMICKSQPLKAFSEVRYHTRQSSTHS